MALDVQINRRYRQDASPREALVKKVEPAARVHKSTKQHLGDEVVPLWFVHFPRLWVEDTNQSRSFPIKPARSYAPLDEFVLRPNPWPGGSGGRPGRRRP